MLGALLDAHVRALRERADAAAGGCRVRPTGAAAAALGVDLRRHAGLDAIGQVRVAVASDPAFPVLAGILVEVGDGAVTLTATDRYRRGHAQHRLPRRG